MRIQLRRSILLWPVVLLLAPAAAGASPQTFDPSQAENAPATPYLALSSIVLESDNPSSPFVQVAGVSRGLSFELAQAFRNENIPIPRSLRLKETRLSQEELAVVVWLRAHEREIAAEERWFHISRQAIAGVIAWEALENVAPLSVKSVGPGKIHICNMKTPACWEAFRLACPGSRCPPDVKGIDETVAQEVEALGLVPPVSLQERIDLLKTSSGAIRYAAAILRAGANEAKRAGWDIDNDPALLATFYRGYTVRAWRNLLRTVDPTSPRLIIRDSNGNESIDEMGAWITRKALLLADGVGTPQMTTTGALLGSVSPESVQGRIQIQQANDEYEGWLRRLEATIQRAEQVRRQERAAMEFQQELYRQARGFGYLVEATGLACEGGAALINEARQGRYSSLGMERRYLTEFLGMVAPGTEVSPCQIELLERIRSASGPVGWQELQSWGTAYRLAHPTVFQRLGSALARFRRAAGTFAASLVPDSSGDQPSSSGRTSDDTGGGSTSRRGPELSDLPAGRQLLGLTGR